MPCIIFDGKSEDFATEMFVIINSTPTRINKSHLVDLYEKVSWAAPDKKFAAQVVEKLYSEGDSPLRYKINRLGGRTQAGEVDPAGGALQRAPPLGVDRLEDHREARNPKREAERFYGIVRDFFKAAEKAWGDGVGQRGVHGHAAR